ncbi:MAG: helix-turn-helix domain-containing protein, partial [Thermofilum sp.]
SRGMSEELRAMGDFLEALPVISAEKIQGERVEEGIVYSRHRIAVLSRRTLEEILQRDSEEPLVYMDRGGIYVKVRGDVLRRLREKRGLSRSDVANELRVSPRMVARYEENLSDATLEVAERLGNLFGPEVFERLSIKALKRFFYESGTVSTTHPKDAYLGQLLVSLARYGYRGYTFSRAPIDAGAKKSEGVLKIAIKKREAQEDEQELNLARELAEETGTRLVVVSEAAEYRKYGENCIVVPKSSASEVAKRIISQISSFDESS